MNKRICEVCKTENEAHYEYCKNCGNQLGVVQKEKVYSDPVIQKTQAQYTPVSPYTSSQTNNVYTAKEQTYNNQYEIKAPSVKDTYGITEIDGVKTEDLAAYIGPNNNRIIKKFAKMELSGSKVSWCWPAALWGLLGLCGVAMWFIYRKMYKLGIILLALGVLLDGVIAYVANGATNSFDNFVSEFLFEGSSNSEFGELEEIPEIENGNNINNDIVTKVALLLGDIVFLSGIAFGGVFGLYIYKKHATKRIKHYNLLNASQRYHQIGLMATGGTSAGFAVLALFVSLFLSEFLDRILFTFI